MENNINDIILESLDIDKTKIKNKINDIIKQIKTSILDNKSIIIEANKIDEKNNNGFIMDFDVVNKIFDNLENEIIFYGDVLLSIKDDDKKIMYGKQVFDIGNVLVINDGNPYVMIEMIIRNIMALNTCIFVNEGYMQGTNKLLISLVEAVFEKDKFPCFIKLCITDDYDKALSNYANIDLVVCIGDHNLQRLILNKGKNNIIVSGYEYFDLYIDDKTNIDFIDKIINTGLNINLYVNKDLDISYYNAIDVLDIDEAIAQINYNGNRYASSIFTSNSLNASKFINEVKSKIVTVNTSPTIERIMDIKQEDLVNIKTVIYPLDYKLDGNRNVVEIDDNI